MVKCLKKQKLKYIFMQSMDEKYKRENFYNKNDSFSVQIIESIV